MTAMEQDLNGVVVTLLYSISSLQAQCADQNYLIADRLPGLTSQQRRALRSTSQTFRSLAERTKEHANLIREFTGLEPAAEVAAG
jgi:hypothetical protein